MNIKYLGSHSDSELTQAYDNRYRPRDLDEFIDAVNKSTIGEGCSCCGDKESKIYAVSTDLEWINKQDLSLCVDCVRRLPEDLMLSSLRSNSMPPVLDCK